MLGFQLVQNRQFRLSVYALMLAGTLAFAAGCGKTSAGDPAAAGAPQAMPVQVKVAQAENVPDTTEYLSVLKSRPAANISPQAEGYITKIYVKSGDHVTAGTPLLQIDPVNQQQVELRYYRVAAPRDGIVGDIPVRVGERVAVTTLLTTVDERGPLEAYIYVPADRARNLKLGLPVHLVDEAGIKVADTRITFLSPQVDAETQTVLAKALLENPQGLRVAQQLHAQVVWSTHDGTVIPILAVTRISGQFFAFLEIKEGNGTVARQKLLKVGDTLGNDYVVLDGIKPGDHIVTSGLQFLQDGMPVIEQAQQTPQTGGK